MKQKKTPYLTNEQLAEALEEAQALGQPTEKVCNYFRLIADHLLGDFRYRHYSKEMREDMASEALLKCIKNIKNYKKEFADKCFNYFTRCIEHSFWRTLYLYYRNINLQRDLVLQYADELAKISPQAADTLRAAQMKVEHNKDKVKFAEPRK